MQGNEDGCASPPLHKGAAISHGSWRFCRASHLRGETNAQRMRDEGMIESRSRSPIAGQWSDHSSASFQPSAPSVDPRILAIHGVPTSLFIAIRSSHTTRRGRPKRSPNPPCIPEASCVLSCLRVQSRLPTFSTRATDPPRNRPVARPDSRPALSS
jgi:hypothetical protein